MAPLPRRRLETRIDRLILLASVVVLLEVLLLAAVWLGRVRVGPGRAAFPPARGGPILGYPEAGPELDTPVPAESAPGRTTPPAPGRGPALALIIDDFGNQWNTQAVQGILSLDIPLTVAVLPNLWASRRIALRAGMNGKEVVLHLPMEPNHRVRPLEPEYLHGGMPSGEVRAFLNAAAASVPGAVGLNNHMGSAATQDSALMGEVARWCAEHGWYILDSITHPASVLYSAAVSAGVPAARRDIFLDHTDEEEAIREALSRAVRLARHRGTPVRVIGHPRPATWRVLRREVPRLTREEGVRWVLLSAAMETG